MPVIAFGQLVRMDLRGRRLLGTLLFVTVVALASAAFVVGLESRDDAGQLWDEAFERARGPHVTLSAGEPALLLPPADDSRVAARSEPVEAMGDVALVRDVEQVELVVRAAPVESPPTVAAPFLVEGRLARDDTEVALERSAALDQGIGIGDRVEVRHGVESAELTVVGTILDFNDCFYPQCDPAVAWATPALLDRLGPDDRFFQAYLRLTDPSAAPAFVTDVLRESGDTLSGSQDWLDTRGDALAVNEFFGAFLAGFGVFVLIAAGVVVAGSVTNRVLARRRDIGLMKAVGVTPAQVVSAITVEHLLLGGVAVAAGWILGSLLTPALRLGVTEVLEPSGATFSPGPLVGTAVTIVAILLLATALPALRAARATAAEALRPAVTVGGRSRVVRLAHAAGAGPVVIGGVKDVFQRPLRTVLAAASMVLAIVALLVTLAFGATVQLATDDPDVTGDPWDAVVVPPGGADVDEVTGTIEATPGVAAWFSESESRQPVDGQVVLARAVGGDPDAAGYVIREGRAMSDPGEAIAGYGLLDRLGKRVGDPVTLEIEGRSIPLTIVGRYSEVEDTGEVLAFRWESLQAAFPDATPSVYRAVATPGTDRETLAADLQTALGPAFTVRPLVVETGDLDAFGVAFWLVAGLVLVVALANLGATVLLGVRERYRDLGVLRAVGFTPGQLVASTAVGTVLVVVLASLIGVPLGLWLGQTLLAAVGRALGAGPELRASPGVLSATTMVAVVIGAAVAIGALTSVGASRRPVSELVRYE